MFLAGIAGSHKGEIWPVTEEGLTLGRAPDNDIVLDERSVSRYHASILLAGGCARFRDLGAVNQALINGVPQGDVELRPGDEVALGQSRFLCMSSLEPSGQHLQNLEEVKTVPLSLMEPTSLKLELASSANKDRPSTVRDLALLYEVSCDLSGAASTHELLERLRCHIEQRLEPECLAVGLLRGCEELSFHDFTGSGLHPQCPCSRELIHRAIKAQEGMLLSRSAPCRGADTAPLATLIAPISVGKTSVGAMVLGRTVSRGAYTQEDLRLLMLLARSLAPALCAVESIEQLRRDNEQLRARSGEALRLVGESRAMSALRAQIARAGRSDLHVLILGETGTGKELVARLLHMRSLAHSEPFVTVNCAAIPRELLESELFGHEKGAFTGADTARTGLLAQAHGGALFLDEIGDLSLDNQARILRAVEQGAFRRVGSDTETRVDVRIIAATNKDLSATIRAGAFREDLYHRIAGVEIHVPPLRERPSDVPLLARHFLELARNGAERPLEGIEPKALDFLRGRSWPGNVRELRNCIFRAAAFTRNDILSLTDVASAAGVSLPEPGAPPLLSLQEAEKRHIADILEQCNGSVRKAAEVLQISRSTLYAKLAEYGMR